MIERGPERIALARYGLARRLAWLESKRGANGRHGHELVLALWLADVLVANPTKTLAEIAASVSMVGERDG